MTDEQFYALVDEEPVDSKEYPDVHKPFDVDDIRPTAEWINWLETVHEFIPERLRVRWSAYSDQPADIWLESVLTREAWEYVQTTVPMSAWRSLAYYVHDDYAMYEVGRIDVINIQLECNLAVNFGFESPWVCPGPLHVETRIN
ncbi:MAG: hypothetical protein ABJX32_04720 [Tateyamaria sp.]|uniref:hypothetical protein n=1 Tax=Tateyamaria sp. TaxID=1929288 RepID=UPI00329BA106